MLNCIVLFFITTFIHSKSQNFYRYSEILHIITQSINGCKEKFNFLFYNFHLLAKSLIYMSSSNKSLITKDQKVLIISNHKQQSSFLCPSGYFELKNTAFEKAATFCNLSDNM